MIELVDGIFIEPKHVTMVRKIDENQCILFFVGQSSIDGGHLLPYAASEVAEEIIKSKYEYESGIDDVE